MDLILWRHAEAAEATALIPDLNDGSRPRREAGARVAAGCASDSQTSAHPSQPCGALPADGACAGAALRRRSEDRPGADVADLISAAAWPEGGKQRGGAVLLVGHQPVFGRLAALLLSGQEADWTIKKGALWWFSNRTGKARPRRCCARRSTPICSRRKNGHRGGRFFLRRVPYRRLLGQQLTLASASCHASTGNRIHDGCVADSW